MSGSYLATFPRSSAFSFRDTRGPTGETILKILKTHGFHDLAYIIAVMAANKQVDVSWMFEQYMFAARVALGRVRIKANAT